MRFSINTILFAVAAMAVGSAPLLTLLNANGFCANVVAATIVVCLPIGAVVSYPNMTKTRRLRRFRLRSLLILVALCCVGLYGLKHQHQQQQQRARERQASDAIRELGGIIEVQENALSNLVSWAGPEWRGMFDHVVRADVTGVGGDALSGPVTSLVPGTRAITLRPMMYAQRLTRARAINDCSTHGRTANPKLVAPGRARGVGWRWSARRL